MVLSLAPDSPAHVNLLCFHHLVVAFQGDHQLILLQSFGVTTAAEFGHEVSQDGTLDGLSYHLGSVLHPPEDLFGKVGPLGVTSHR